MSFWRSHHDISQGDGGCPYTKEPRIWAWKIKTTYMIKFTVGNKKKKRLYVHTMVSAKVKVDVRARKSLGYGHGR